LAIEVGTVKKHVGHILRKLRLRDRLQIGLRYARTAARGEASSAIAPGRGAKEVLPPPRILG
jgi:hypothetical protein